DQRGHVPLADGIQAPGRDRLQHAPDRPGPRLGDLPPRQPWQPDARVRQPAAAAAPLRPALVRPGEATADRDRDARDDPEVLAALLDEADGSVCLEDRPLDLAERPDLSAPHLARQLVFADPLAREVLIHDAPAVDEHERLAL